MKKKINFLEEKVIQTITTNAMVGKGETLFVAVSGGPDSICLLYVLHAVARVRNIRLIVIHVNHTLRGVEADSDERFVQTVARRLKLPFIRGKVDVKALADEHRLSIEEAARRGRYDFLIQEAKQHDVKTIALGHTKDDQAETVLMRMMKGTGLRGLSAIRAVLPYDGIRIIRPFLFVEREEIMRYIQTKRVCFREDASNASLQFVRNKVRHRLIPYLEKEYNPHVEEALSRLASSTLVDFAYLEEEALRYFKQCVIAVSSQRICFDRNKFCNTPLALQFRILEKGCALLGKAGTFDYSHWDFFQNEINQKKKIRLCLANKMVLEAAYNEIALASVSACQQDWCYVLGLNQKVYVKEARMIFECTLVPQSRATITKKKNVECFDYHLLHFPLIIRNRKQGDRFCPLGMSGKKKIKDFFIEHKIPSYQRNTIPLIVSNENIVWVVPFRISDQFKITAPTKRVVKISMRELS